jgi:hypothetical protein
MEARLTTLINANTERLLTLINNNMERTLARIDALGRDLANLRTEQGAMREFILGLPRLMLDSLERPLLARLSALEDEVRQLKRRLGDDQRG